MCREKDEHRGRRDGYTVLVLIENWNCRGGPVARPRNRERMQGWDGLDGERRAQRDISGCALYGARALTMVPRNERNRREWRD